MKVQCARGSDWPSNFTPLLLYPFCLNLGVRYNINVGAVRAHKTRRWAMAGARSAEETDPEAPKPEVWVPYLFVRPWERGEGAFARVPWSYSVRTVAPRDWCVWKCAHGVLLRVSVRAREKAGGDPPSEASDEKPSEDTKQPRFVCRVWSV